MASRILICEDEQFVRWALAEHLRSDGYTVVEAQNGIEALKRVAEARPDAILLDLNMPEMSGLTALRKMRDLGVDSPVFILSGFGTAGSQTEATELGVAGFIHKPYYLSEVSQLLDTALEKRAA